MTDGRARSSRRSRINSSDRRHEAAPRRHDRVWLGAGWRAALRAAPAPGLRDAAAAWILAGRPLVATRRLPSHPGAVALGLALAPGAAVRRLALAVDPGAVVRIAPPLALRDVLGAAPVSWRPPLAALDAAARAAGIVLRVHGSLLWQHLSGASFLGPGSDVDLLARPRDGGTLRALLALLSAADGRDGPRLDGEVILPGERGVAWRELASGAGVLLVKSPAGVALLPRAVALGALAGGPP